MPRTAAACPGNSDNFLFGIGISVRYSEWFGGGCERLFGKPYSGDLAETVLQTIENAKAVVAVLDWSAGVRPSEREREKALRLRRFVRYRGRAAIRMRSVASTASHGIVFALKAYNEHGY